MSELVVNTLWNVNVYLAGVGLLGRAAEIDVPQPKRLMEEYKGLGMAGRIKIPVGWDALESRVKWTSFDETTLLALAQTRGLQQLSALGDLQTLSSAGQIAEQPVIFNFTGVCKDPGPIHFKAQENIEYTSMFDIYHVDLSIGGTSVYVFDALSNLYIVGGVDQLAQYRANIGA